MTDTPKSDRPTPPQPTDEQLAEQMNQLWAQHPEWGTPDDYNAMPDRYELDGFTVGQRVRVFEDVTDDKGMERYAGDEGLVVGIFHTGAGMFRAQPTTGLLVLWDDFADPAGITPGLVEHE